MGLLIVEDIRCQRALARDMMIRFTLTTSESVRGGGGLPIVATGRDMFQGQKKGTREGGI